MFKQLKVKNINYYPSLFLARVISFLGLCTLSTIILFTDSAIAGTTGQVRGDGICYTGTETSWYSTHASAASDCFAVQSVIAPTNTLNNVTLINQCTYNTLPFSTGHNAQPNRQAWTLGHNDPVVFGGTPCEDGGVPTSSGWVIVSTTEFVCLAGTTWSDITHLCEIDIPDCSVTQGTEATPFGVFGGYTSTADFPIVACSNNCITVYTGSGANTYPYSVDPTSFYFTGQYHYSDIGADCSAQAVTPSISPIPAEVSPPPPIDPTDVDYEGNGSCPNGWFLLADGSCTPTSDPSDPLNGGEADCPTGTYFATDLNSCIGINDPIPADPNFSGSPTGGGTGNEVSTGGSDGTGIAVTESGVDSNNDGNTGDEGICIQFPQLDICKISAITDEGCGQPPACSGDAIQCNISLQLWRLNCNSSNEFDVTDIPEVQGELDGILGGVGIDGSELEETPINVATSIDQTSIYASQCPPDYQLDLFSETYTLSFSQICSLLMMVGNFVILIGGIHSAKIVFT